MSEKQATKSSNSGKNPHFNIISLDGASATGGLGWVSIGFLRDYLHQYLEIDPRTKKQFRAAFRHLDTFNHTLSTEEKINVWQTASSLLKGWPAHDWFPLWHSKPARKFPLPIELATIRLAVLLETSQEQKRQEIMDELQEIVEAREISWRLKTARYVPISRFRSEFSGGLESTVNSLIRDPRGFLQLRWFTGAPFPPSLAALIPEAHEALQKWIREGYVVNKLFGELSQTNLLAGTSSGGLNAMVIAKHEHLVDGIQEALEMWQGLSESIVEEAPSYLSKRVIGALAGQNSFFGLDSEAVYQRHFGNKQTLADLKHKIAITSLQLDSGEHHSTPPIRRWKPVLFHNLKVRRSQEARKVDGIPIRARKLNNSLLGIHAAPSTEHQTDLGLPLIDLARSTSSIPVLGEVFVGKNSIHTDLQHPDADGAQSGYLDGGFYANNPSLAAVSLALSLGHSIQDLSVFSLGNGRQAIDHVELEHGDLGYNSWLLNRNRKGLMFDIMLDSAIDAVNAYCSTVLGSAHFSEGYPFSGGRYLRAEVWMDRRFMKHQVSGEQVESLDQRIDEALGIYRYIYSYDDNVRGLFNGFFNEFWK